MSSIRIPISKDRSVGRTPADRGVRCLRIFGCLLLFLCSYSSIAVGQVRHYEQATTLLAENTPEANAQAIRLFKKALVQDSSSAPAHLGLARAYRQGIRQYDLDKTYLDTLFRAGKKAARLDPSLTEAYTLLADVYRRYVNHSAARLVLTDAVAANPDDSVLLTYLGRNYFDTGNCGMARPHLERSMEIGPVPLTHRYLGWCHFYLRQPEKQQELFTRYVELEPDNDQGMGGLVWSYTMQERFDEAIAVAERFLKEKQDIPNFSWIVANAAEVHLFASNENRAQSLYERALSIDSTAINQFAGRRVTTTLGHLYWQDERYDEARRLLEKTLHERRDIIELVERYNGIPFPERWEYAYDIASAYAVRGDREYAYRWLYRAVLTGYPAHLAYDDPLMEAFYDDPAYQQLIRQARTRVDGEWEDGGGRELRDTKVK